MTRERRVRDWARRLGLGVRGDQSLLPLTGYAPSTIEAGWLDLLTDDQLSELNRVLPWNCFTVDRRGRRFGNAAWRGKRDTPEQIPDRRIVLLDRRFGLEGRRVLEAGCFEGVHTIALCLAGATVTAVDARVVNVVKTIVRCAMYGVHPTVVPYDLDVGALPGLPNAEIVHHVGVLYHLARPVEHLVAVARLTEVGMMLDTHVARPEQATDVIDIEGRTYKVMRYRESGLRDPFSGIHTHAVWLQADDLLDILNRVGMSVEIVETREERNGRRVLLFAQR